jgi:hypothetical protein
LSKILHVPCATKHMCRMQSHTAATPTSKHVMYIHWAIRTYIWQFVPRGVQPNDTFLDLAPGLNGVYCISIRIQSWICPTDFVLTSYWLGTENKTLYDTRHWCVHITSLLRSTTWTYSEYITKCPRCRLVRHEFRVRTLRVSYVRSIRLWHNVVATAAEPLEGRNQPRSRQDVP